jgi:hypothetical protein
MKSGNADGGKELQFKADAGSDEGYEIGETLRNSDNFRSCKRHHMWKPRKNSNFDLRSHVGQYWAVLVVECKCHDRGRRVHAFGGIPPVIPDSRDFPRANT